MRRVDICCTDFARYLRREADNAWDVVYFDPMFTETIAAARASIWSAVWPARAVRHSPTCSRPAASPGAAWS